MVDYAYALKDGRLTGADETELSSARSAVSHARAVAQMNVSNKIIEAEGDVYWRLAHAYGDLRRIEKKQDPELRGRHLDELIERLDETMSQLRYLRAVMRADLKLEDTEESGG